MIPTTMTTTRKEEEEEIESEAARKKRERHAYRVCARLLPAFFRLHVLKLTGLLVRRIRRGRSAFCALESPSH